MNHILNIVTALPCEARPFIDYYRLQKQQQHTAFTVYSNQERNINLIVSQIGKINMAAAVSYLHFVSGQHPYSVFVNIGIAGSGQHSLNECIYVDKITDSTQQKSYYPFVVKTTLPRAALTSFDAPSHQYNHPNIMDMEASSFFQTATKFVCLEQVQVIKIISDIDAESSEAINAKSVTDQINSHIPTILPLLNTLQKLSIQEAQYSSEIPHFEQFLISWHFTQYQQTQLKELLRRWFIHCKEINPLNRCKDCASSKAVLPLLHSHLQKTAYTWTPST